MIRSMKWSVRLIPKRNRKRTFRVKASSIEDLAEKLSKHANKFLDLEIETPVNDPAYWKSLILMKLFQKTHTHTLF